MMRPTRALPLALALLTPVLASCGQAEKPPAVPAGVAQQHSTLRAEVAERGGSLTTGEWEVSYIVESAEPWYQRHGGHQQFRAPAAGETHHIEIIPVEKATGRVVPDVPITVDVVDASGRTVDSEVLRFYHGAFFHYASNFSVPDPGTYTLRATLEPPTFLRHGEQGETPPLSEGATATFADVRLSAG